jgi:fructokinase
MQVPGPSYALPMRRRPFQTAIGATMGNEPKPVVVGLGELLFDLLPLGKQLGGAPANFAHHAQQLGMEGWVCSAVGTDSLGDDLLNAVIATGSNACVERVDAPTGTVDVHLDDQGQPAYRIAEAVAWDGLPYSDQVANLAHRTDAVCFGTLAQRNPITRQTIRQFLNDVPSGGLKVFDVNLRQGYWDKQTIEQSCHLADVVKLNDEEWAVFGELFDLSSGHGDAASQLCERFDLRWIVLTRGGAGSRLFNNTDQWSVEAESVTIVDTVGAGDAFTAMVVSGLLRNESPAQILQAATRVASFVCTQQGATPSLPAGIIEPHAV